ncbi:MAG TPA: ABC transporter substrate-binding protein [Candidatus Limnocylindria bacterium]|jgi:NitT/TauT family transport system substrate-binding protein|nr:ABC transporter substrate-binding protein [Candidatus Limnocylindria bacterium]
MRRGALLAGAAAFAAASTLRARAAEGTVRIGVVASDVSAEPYYADANGFYARAGLQAQIEALAGGGAIIDAVASGSLDVGFANLTSAAAARQRAIPIALLAPATVYTSKAPITVLVKARGSPLRSGADLRGKTLAVSTLRGELQVAASLWIDKTGGDARSVHFVELPFASMAPALAGGRVDAAMITEPAMTIQKDRIELLADAYDAIADEFLIGGWVAASAWAKSDAARRFGGAMAETARWANAHRAQTAQILAARIKLDPAVARAMVRATYGERLTPQTIQPVLDAAAKYGSLRSPMQAAELIA